MEAAEGWGRGCREMREIERGGAGEDGDVLGAGVAVVGGWSVVTFVRGVVEGAALFDSFCSGSDAALFSMCRISNPFKNSLAASMRSSVCRLMTPRVKWIAPGGRIALGGMSTLPSSSGVVSSAVKRWREACSWHREEGVQRGRQRKWVRGGLGGI